MKKSIGGTKDMEEFNQFVYNNSYKERRNKMIKKIEENYDKQ